MRKRKIRSWLLAGLMAAGVCLSGCSDTQTNTQNNIVNWSVCYSNLTGTDPEELSGFLEDNINGILADEGKDYQIEVNIIDNGEMTGEPDISLSECKSRKEQKVQTDLITIMEPGSPEDLTDSRRLYVQLCEEDLLLPLDELLETETGTLLKAAVPQYDLDKSKINGVQYGISAFEPQFYSVAYSKEMMDQLGIDESEISTGLFENEDLFRQVLEETGEAPLQIYSGNFKNNLGRLWIQDCLGMGIGDDGSYVNLYDSDEFLQTTEKLQEWKNEVLLETTVQNHTVPDRKSFAFPLTDVSVVNNRTEPYFLTLDVGNEQKEFYIVPDPKTPLTDNFGTGNMTCLASWTANEENAFDFLTELYTNSEIADFLQYGTEGENYSKTEDGTVELLSCSTPNEKLLELKGWTFTNPLISSSTQTMPADKLETALSFYESSDWNIPAGFWLDIRPVAQQAMTVNNIVFSSASPEEGGDPDFYAISVLEMDDPEATINNLVAKMNAAGMQDVLDEANSQLEQWRSNQ